MRNENILIYISCPFKYMFTVVDDLYAFFIKLLYNDRIKIMLFVKYLKET